MDEQEAKVGCYKHHRDRIHSYEYDLVWSCMVAEALKRVVCTHDEYHCDSLGQPEGGFDYWGIPYSMISPADRHQILPYLGYGKSMSEEAPSHWDWCTGRRNFSKPLGKVKSVTFPNNLESLRDLLIRVLHVACIELWELYGAWGTYWRNIRQQGDSPSLGGALCTGW